MKKFNKPLSGITIKIIGYGCVGKNTAKVLDEWGANIWVWDIDEKKKIPEKFKGKNIMGKDIDILVPCACSDIINKNNWENMLEGYSNLKLIVEGGNCQIAEGIKEKLRAKGVKIIDDWQANAGGVIASHCEIQGMSTKDAFQEIKKRMG